MLPVAPAMIALAFLEGPLLGVWTRFPALEIHSHSLAKPRALASMTRRRQDGDMHPNAVPCPCERQTRLKLWEDERFPTHIRPTSLSAANVNTTRRDLALGMPRQPDIYLQDTLSNGS